MTLNISVLTPNRIVWDSEVEEIVLSTNSGQIGILPLTSNERAFLRFFNKDEF